MAEDEDFWDDLLAHVRQRVLIPVTGPDLNTVVVDGTSRTLTSLIATRLVERYDLDVSSAHMTMGEAAAAFIRKRGRDEAERLYRVVSDIIEEVGDQPCAPLRELAKITDLPLFVSTTPDRLLANAINDVRFGGQSHTRELTFSPNQSTGALARSLHAPAESDTTVVRLFGQAASTPQYAVHDEDLLEWLHALLSDSGSLPRWIAYALKHQPLLFIGCEIPDWLGLFLLRLSSSTRISLESKQFFFVGSSIVAEPRLSSFFSTYCRRTQVQQLQMEPGEFVTELHRRWETHLPAWNRRNAVDVAIPRPAAPPTIFISYMREDIDRARRLHDFITDLGGDVWLDERRLWPGDSWEDEILRAIRKRIRLFVPIISANTDQEDEGYVFREWREAVERSYAIPRRRFIIPVVVDDQQDVLSTYRQVPEEFRRYNFGYAPTGEPDKNLRSMLIEEIRAMRRSGAA
jgi:TIR domain